MLQLVAQVIYSQNLDESGEGNTRWRRPSVAAFGTELGIAEFPTIMCFVQGGSRVPAQQLVVTLDGRVGRCGWRGLCKSAEDVTLTEQCDDQ